jgi:Spy/CpxP family protein refolding chaperone
MKQQIVKFATVAAVAAGMAFAQAPAPPAAPAQPKTPKTWTARRGAMRQRMMKALNLTDAQKQQAKTIFQQAKQNAQPLRDQLKQNREALAAAVKADNVAQIQSLTAERGKLEGQMLGIRTEALARFYSTLTPDQKAKADQMHERIKARMHQRRQQRNANNG